ncbi:hypothetical protein [Leptospira sarikeiensis]|uniref:Uncharacterized protein n=1 Tax=Leptospira sarikeiensis TaxID=2484943 RepID=A0A4R9KE09_9LEPT|nr:hypothetical protein [Leptospira sarikeiensis]TGL63423.1 hypothetical protein EHQ64_05560 [Leptospira sarikeiensis]
MQVVLVFKREILGFGFESNEKDLIQNSSFMRKRLGQWIRKNRIQTLCFVERIEKIEGSYIGFIGFAPREYLKFGNELEADEFGTGKYLKIDYSPLSGGKSKIRTFMKENNIRTDGSKIYVSEKPDFSKGSLYLRIMN